MQRAILFSFGILYFWFGVLKFFPGVSPAEALAGETIHIMTFGILSQEVSNFLLAILECAIGLGLMLNLFIRPVIKIMVLHLICTFSPLVLLPEQVFVSFPFVLTLTGQYILKNIVFISVGVYLLIQIGERKQDVNTPENEASRSIYYRFPQLRKLVTNLNSLF